MRKTNGTDVTNPSSGAPEAVPRGATLSTRMQIGACATFGERTRKAYAQSIRRGRRCRHGGLAIASIPAPRVT